MEHIQSLFVLRAIQNAQSFVRRVTGALMGRSGATFGRNWTTDPWTTHDATINLWRHAESLFLIVNNDTRPHDAADKHGNLISLGRGTGEGGRVFVRIRRRCGWHVTIWLCCLWCGAVRLGRKVLSFRMSLSLLSSGWKTCKRTKTQAAASFYNANNEDVCETVEVCLHTFLTLLLIASVFWRSAAGERTAQQQADWMKKQGLCPSREMNPESPVVHPAISSSEVLGAESCLRSWQLHNRSRDVRNSLKPGGSVPCSHFATFPYSEPDESNPLHYYV